MASVYGVDFGHCEGTPERLSLTKDSQDRIVYKLADLASSLDKGDARRYLSANFADIDLDQFLIFVRDVAVSKCKLFVQVTKADLEVIFNASKAAFRPNENLSAVNNIMSTAANQLYVV